MHDSAPLVRQQQKEPANTQGEVEDESSAATSISSRDKCPKSGKIQGWQPPFLSSVQKVTYHILEDLNRWKEKITANILGSGKQWHRCHMKTSLIRSIHLPTFYPHLAVEPERRWHGTHRWKSIKWLALAGMGNVSAWSRPGLDLLPPNALYLVSSTLKAPHHFLAIPPWIHVKIGNCKN